MHTPKFHSSTLFPIPIIVTDSERKYRDDLKIDQFFGSVGCLKSTGFPASDVSLLERLQRTNPKAVDALKSHMPAAAQAPQYDKRPAFMQMATVRPQWAQTPLEVMEHEQRVQNYTSNLETEQTQSQNETDVLSSNVTD